MTVEKRSGLSSEKRVSRVPAGKASPKATGRIQVILLPAAVTINARFHVLTALRLGRAGSEMVRGLEMPADREGSAVETLDPSAIKELCCSIHRRVALIPGERSRFYHPFVKTLFA